MQCHLSCSPRGYAFHSEPPTAYSFLHYLRTNIHLIINNTDIQNIFKFNPYNKKGKLSKKLLLKYLGIMKD